MRTACFTICSNNYVASSAVLARSFHALHADFDFFICLADEIDANSTYPSLATVVPAHQLGIPDFVDMAFRYNVLELNTAIKPFMFLWLMEQGYEAVLYFDPDIEIFSPLQPILEPLTKGASFVLTPHLCSPAADWLPRHDIDIMQTGVFNLGFLACSRQREALELLRWWARRLRYQCVVDTGSGIFVDQKFMDLIPGFADRVFILRDTTCNVAYWNLAQRSLTFEKGRWAVDGRPLTFFHFSGFSPENPTRLSKYAPADAVDAQSPLGILLARHAHALRGAGHGRAFGKDYAYAAFNSGTRIPDLARRMFRDIHPYWWGDPFENYEEYLSLPDPASASGSTAFAVTNLMRYVYDSRDDLRRAFDLDSPAGVDAFRGWFVEHAGELGLQRETVAPVAASAA